MTSVMKLRVISAIGFGIAVFLALGSVDSSTSSSSGGSSGSSPSSGQSASSGEQVTSAYKARFAKVSKIWTDVGARVEPFDPSFPYQMWVTLPSGLATELTDKQVREMAGLARSRLHDEAVVTIMSEGGQQLAQASRSGVH